MMYMYNIVVLGLFHYIASHLSARFCEYVILVRISLGQNSSAAWGFS
jgi:hypothetical protein